MTQVSTLDSYNIKYKTKQNICDIPVETSLLNTNN